jgi:septal ring factor EnvC (AmiA/AmiB activator)
MNTALKTSNPKTDTQKLAGHVKLARERAAIAERQFQAARERARLAKRRRKEIKLIARRARKQAKQAKAALAEAKEALAEAEAKLANLGKRLVSGRPAKARPAAKASAAAPRKRVTPRCRDTPISSATPAVPGPATPNQPALGPEQSPSAIASVVAAQDGETKPDSSGATPLPQPDVT